MAGGPDWIIPWIPRIIPQLPRNTPTIDEQLRCPPGTHRGRPGEGCVPDEPPPPPRLVEIPGTPPTPREPTGRERPPKNTDARGPLPPIIVEPPLPPVQPPPVSPGPAPASIPDATTGRYFPRASAPAPRGTFSTLLGVGGLLAWVLGTLVIGPYFTTTTREYEEELRRTSTSGPPRRTRRRPPSAEDLPPYYRYEGPWPYTPGMPAPGPIPLPRRTPRAPATPRSGPAGTALPAPARPRTLPGTRTPVQGVPAPAGWTLGDPLPGVGYDPYTVAPPTPAPRASPRSAPRTRSPVWLPVWFPIGDPVSRPAPTGRPRVRPLTPQQPSSPRPLPRQPVPQPAPIPRLPPGPTLTPFDEPVPTSQPQGLRKPTSANPCTTERTARRQRQKDCKRYTTKTIRVCADK